MACHCLPALIFFDEGQACADISHSVPRCRRPPICKCMIAWVVRRVGGREDACQCVLHRDDCIFHDLLFLKRFVELIFQQQIHIIRHMPLRRLCLPRICRRLSSCLCRTAPPRRHAPWQRHTLPRDAQATRRGFLRRSATPGSRSSERRVDPIGRSVARPRPTRARAAAGVACAAAAAASRRVTPPAPR